MGRLDDILIEDVNCVRSVSQPIIFNWQDGGSNKMKNVTLAGIAVHNYGTKPGEDLSPMNGKCPDANNNGLANAFGIWARGVDGLQIKDCAFYDDGGSKRAKFVFDRSAEHVDISGPRK